MNKKHFAFAVILIAIAYIAGRYSAPAKTVEVEKEKIVYREKVDEQKERDQTTRKTEVRLPDGTVTIETVIRSNTKTKRITEQKTEIKHEAKKESISRNGVILQALAGIRMNDLAGGMNYGVSFTAPIPLLGLPIYAGAWTILEPSLNVGVSLGFAL